MSKSKVSPKPRTTRGIYAKETARILRVLEATEQIIEAIRWKDVNLLLVAANGARNTARPPAKRMEDVQWIVQKGPAALKECAGYIAELARMLGARAVPSATSAPQPAALSPWFTPPWGHPADPPALSPQTAPAAPSRNVVKMPARHPVLP
jgi:hypothetical protein